MYARDSHSFLSLADHASSIENTKYNDKKIN
jgi:hypothetical protein